MKTKRREVREVATLVKLIKKNIDEPESSINEPREEAWAALTGEKTRGERYMAAGNTWSAQQQETVSAYVCSRGMEPQEVLQAWRHGEKFA
jgi:hypothetical protein